MSLFSFQCYQGNVVFYRFEFVYLNDEIRVAKDIRGDYLVVDLAPYTWKE